MTNVHASFRYKSGTILRAQAYTHCTISINSNHTSYQHTFALIQSK